MSMVKLRPDPPNRFKTYEKALVFIIRNDKKIKERSIQKFNSKSEFDQYLELANEALGDSSEIYIVHLRNAQPPEGTSKRISQAWCPYCTGWRSYFSKDGYKHCEICLKTTADFYWKKYNQRAPISTPTEISPTSKATTDEEKREKRRLRREKRKKAREAKK